MKPTQLGLPTDDLTRSRTLFLPDARTMCVELIIPPDSQEMPVSRVCARKCDESHYCPLASPASTESDFSMLPVDGRSIYFLRATGRPSPGGWGMSSTSIVRVELPSGSWKSFPVSGFKPWFIIDLLAVDKDGSALFATVSSPDLGRGDARKFAVARLDLTSGSVQALMDLPGIWV